MFTLASEGITPDEYAQFYKIYEASGLLVDLFQSNHNVEEEEDEYKEEEDNQPNDAENYTLLLKIQMKGVTKPPMWREVEVPSNYTFLQLHEVIQEVTGLEDSHLWQFNRNAYDTSLLIGIKQPMHDPFIRGVYYVTHEADATLITQFLHQKGNKLEYNYDFGDDWIFTIEVKNVLDKKSYHPVCVRYKSELNAIEDIGGIWEYMQLRDDLENWDSLSKKYKKERCEDIGFEKEKSYKKFLDEHCFNLEGTNNILADM